MKSSVLCILALVSLVSTPLVLLAEEGAVYQVKVSGMSCAGCSMGVTGALKKLDHVTEVFVDSKAKIALVAVDNAEGPGETAVLEAVKAAGFEGQGYEKLAKTFAESKADLTSGS